MKIALLGYGKMGKAINALITEANKHSVVLKISSNNLNDATISNLKEADVAIEFSKPAKVLDNINLCFEAGVPIVIGTTGWYKNLETVKKNCVDNKQAMLYASNFSVGVNLFFKINRLVNQLFLKYDAYDVSIEEIHHTQKVDAPSGTAISLANDILNEHPIKNTWKNELNAPKEVLSIIAKREIDVKGTHTVTWQSENDEISIKHEAFNRNGFAKGAILAAEWLVGKTGCFTINDVLKI